MAPAAPFPVGFTQSFLGRFRAISSTAVTGAPDTPGPTPEFQDSFRGNSRKSRSVGEGCPL
eukprot:455967-Pyramimonas_sp.AAC.1